MAYNIFTARSDSFSFNHSVNNAYLHLSFLLCLSFPLHLFSSSCHSFFPSSLRSVIPSTPLVLILSFPLHLLSSFCHSFYSCCLHSGHSFCTCCLHPVIHSTPVFYPIIPSIPIVFILSFPLHLLSSSCHSLYTCCLPKRKINLFVLRACS